ncbi:acyl carrier protein [Streptomyces clavuligerus]|uniref:Peptide carrier protein n=1 Tax=Streptomyces clavuligerus TaxID=1901 RepID=B5GU49_STRCL|nr:acyl carrier protein [Streptomyces clavuligerus]ANW21343.1 polyketide synthase [Streptomyces clavuligerus]AXU15969.1 polyketide synthase [Streptomyces clavuligerus]EDY49845.1 peptide carrier protein [Streptomyces clavuligerus]EFG05528.1 peptide carrier protein [Streptomyces clavuligerus]MBY6306103.1 acyl carrier protein [Streptomyces clavuligerus]
MSVPASVPASVPSAGPAAAQHTEHSVESLSGWLADRIALYLKRSPAEIVPSVPLAEYGLDSVAALSLCGDIEEDFDLVLEPTVAWDYPTVDALAGHLVEELRALARDAR